MKKSLLTLVICLVGIMVYAQDITDNGNNLSEVCPTESCIYIAYSSTIYFPFEEDKQWEIRNMEIAIKKNGQFMASGDLYVFGVDTAAALKLELVFVSVDDKELLRHPIPEFEFYNEPGAAEPFFNRGEMDAPLVSQIGYVDVDIDGSRLMPYYEVKSDCYHACKEHKLKEAMKAFKKAK